MTDSSDELSSRLDDGVNRLIAKVNDLKALNLKQSEQIDSLKHQLDEARRDADTYRDELDSCQLAIALGDGSAKDHSHTTDEAKKQISHLVRGIDECIALLKQ